MIEVESVIYKVVLFTYCRLRLKGESDQPDSLFWHLFKFNVFLNNTCSFSSFIFRFFLQYSQTLTETPEWYKYIYIYICLWNYMLDESQQYVLRNAISFLLVSQYLLDIC
jgi:hypothetical protein